MRAGPPGWEPHKTSNRVDGWICDPADGNRIPAAVAELIARAMPQPGNDAVAVIRARMYARHKKVFPND